MRFCYSITESQLELIHKLDSQEQVGFEIRLDSFAKQPDPVALRQLTKKPLLATYRSKPHFGMAEVSARDLEGRQWREACARAGFEFVDLECDEPQLPERIAAFHEQGCQTVLSHHELSENSKGLDQALELALATEASIIKIIGSGTETRDLAEQRQRYQKANGRSLVHFYMGADFAATRVLCLVYGGSFTFLAPDPSQAVAPGQLSYEQISQVYRPKDKMKLFAVIGQPIGHSRSPQYHNPILQKIADEALFLPLPASSADDLMILQNTFPELLGMAITKPMKEVSFAKANGFIGDEVQDLGAINTLLKREGQWLGTNTDLLAMKELLAQWQEPDSVVRILGFGGLGKAVLSACLSLGLKVEVSNRTAGKVAVLPEGAVEIPWEERHREGATVIVQATSAGMAPYEALSPLESLPNSLKCLIETIYNPKITKLMAMARAKGVPVVDGFALFEGQAAIQSKLFSELLLK